MASKGNKLIFANAEKARDAITESQKKEITKLYQQWSDEIGERARYYSRKSTSSSVVSERQMKELQKQLKETSHQVSNEVYKNIKNNIYTVSDAVVRDNVEWLKQFGFEESGLNVAFSSVPDQIVRMLATGQIYEGGWNLSSRIWSDNESTLKTAYQIVAKGMAENRPIYDIAKELESYVQPGAEKKWNPYIMMKNTKTGEWERKKLYKRQVDYNAQRLARTLVQHGYQQSFIAVTEKNPFVLRYQWLANGSRPCPLCQSRNGEEFAKDNLPMDHPNGQCTMVPVIDSNMGDKLADWFNSPDGTYPEIDSFAKSFGYSGKANGTKKDISSLGTSKAKTFNYWYTKLDSSQKALAKELKEKSGLTWQKWYEQNIYSGKEVVAEEGSQSTGIKLDKKKWQKMFDDQTTRGMLDIEKEAFGRMSAKQLEAIEEYTGSSYTEMNSYLRYIAQGMSESKARSMSGIEDYQLQAIKDAREGLSKASTQKDYVVYRGTDRGDLAGFLPGDFEANKSKLNSMSAEELAGQFNNTVGKYAGFTSTCSNNSDGQWDNSMFRKDGWSKGVEFAMYVPSNTPASSIMGISQYGTGEGEFLLNAGTKIYIHEVEETNSGTIRVWASVLN